jgi:hypothetical protein
MDFVVVGITAVFFVVTVLYVTACDQLGRTK